MNYFAFSALLYNNKNKLEFNHFKNKSEEYFLKFGFIKKDIYYYRVNLITLDVVFEEEYFVNNIKKYHTEFLNIIKNLVKYYLQYNKNDLNLLTNDFYKILIKNKFVKKNYCLEYVL